MRLRRISRGASARQIGAEPVQPRLRRQNRRRKRIPGRGTVNRLERVRSLLHHRGLDPELGVELLEVRRRHRQIPIRRAAILGGLVEGVPRLKDRRQLVRDTEHAERVRNLTLGELLGELAGDPRPRGGALLRRASRPARPPAGGQPLLHRGPVATCGGHELVPPVNAGHGPREHRHHMLVAELCVIRPRRPAAILSVPARPAHLDIGAGRQSRRRMTTAGAARVVGPADAEHPLLPPARGEALSLQPLLGVGGGEPAERVHGTGLGEVDQDRRRTGAVGGPSVAPAAEHVADALDPAGLTIQLGGRQPACEPGELLESRVVAVDRRQQTVVLL